MKFEVDPKTGKPNNSLPYWNRGQYLRKMGDTKRALEDYSVAVSVNPKNPELYNSRGKTYFDLAAGGKLSQAESGDYLQKAMNDYMKAADLAQNKPKSLSEILINRGAAYGMAGVYDKALADLNKGIELDPQNKNGYFNRSIVYFNTAKYDMAIKDYSSYLQYDPYSPNMWYERGMLYRTMKQYPEAIADLSKCIQIKADFGLAYLERARAKGFSGDKAGAEADYRMAKQYGQAMQQMDMQIMGQ
jgi:tetratricopeptide (TPR) repeat protein